MFRIISWIPDFELLHLQLRITIKSLVYEKMSYLNMATLHEMFTDCTRLIMIVKRDI